MIADLETKVSSNLHNANFLLNVIYRDFITFIKTLYNQNV